MDADLSELNRSSEMPFVMFGCHPAAILVQSPAFQNLPCVAHWHCAFFTTGLGIEYRRLLLFFVSFPDEQQRPSAWEFSTTTRAEQKRDYRINIGNAMQPAHVLLSLTSTGDTVVRDLAQLCGGRQIVRGRYLFHRRLDVVEGHRFVAIANDGCALLLKIRHRSS